MASFLFKLKEDSLQMVLIVHHKVVFTPAFHLMHIKHMLALKDIFSVQIIYKSWFFSLCVAQFPLLYVYSWWLVALLWNNDDLKVKLRTCCVVLRIEMQKKKKSPLAQSEWFEWNRVPTRSLSPADDREVPAQESGNGPLFFRGR